MQSYRKLYQDYYHINLPKDYDIHHIDFNHDNNNVKNLIALPRDLHSQLHQSYSNLMRLGIDNVKLNDLTLVTGAVNSNTLLIQYLYEYLEVITLCMPYMNKREFARYNNERGEMD